MSNLRALPAPPPRLSPALRAAIDLRIRKGLTIAEACREAGLSPQGYHKAMKRPAVRDHISAVRLAFASECDGLRAVARARAIIVGIELMQEGQPAAVRARMVEFFAGESKAAPVAVHVDNRMVTGPGYRYIRPEERLADILDGDNDD